MVPESQVVGKDQLTNDSSRLPAAGDKSLAVRVKVSGGTGPDDTTFRRAKIRDVQLH